MADSCSDSPVSCCLLCFSARKADMHFSLPPPFFSHCYPFSSVLLHLSFIFFLFFECKLSIPMRKPADRRQKLLTLNSSLSHTTNSEFSLVNHEVHKKPVLLDSCESSCSAHQLSLRSCDACPALRQTANQGGSGDELVSLD